MVWDGTRWVRDTAAAHTPGADGPRRRRRIRWGRIAALSVAALVVGSLVGAALPATPGAATSPTLTLDPVAAAPGSTIHVTGDHLLAFVSYQLTWDGSALGQPEVETDGQGAFRVDWTVPSAPLGAHVLSMFPVGHVSEAATPPVATATFTVAEGDPAVAGLLGEPYVPNFGESPTASPTDGPAPGAGATTTPGQPAGGTTSPPGPGHAPAPPSKPKPAPHPGAPCGTSLQSLINSAASGSTVYLGSCTYHESIKIDKPLTLVGPATIDGDGSRQGISVTASHVTIDGLTVRRVASGAYQGAVNVQGVSDFTLRNAVIRDSSTICVAIAGGSGHVVASSELTGCGKEGYFLNDVSDTLFQSDRIHGNNPAGKYDPGWEAGGGKAIGSSHLTFRGNRSYGNRGAGFWCDEGCSGVTFSGNRAYDNSGAGIMFEISSGATITGNVVYENGWGSTSWGWGAGILVSSSSAVTVSGNTVAWNADGISVISQDRGKAGPDDVHGVVVRDNTIAMAPQPGDHSDVMALAWLQDWNGVLFASGSANGGSGNAYWWSGAVPHCGYGWNGCYSSLTAFNATPGDQSGVALSSSTKAARLTAAGIPASPQHH